MVLSGQASRLQTQSPTRTAYKAARIDILAVCPFHELNFLCYTLSISIMTSTALTATDQTASLASLDISNQTSSKYMLLDPTDIETDTVKIGTVDDISSFVEERTLLATSHDQNHWQTVHQQKPKAAYEGCWKGLDACESPGRGTTKLELQNHMMITDWTQLLPGDAEPVEDPESKIYQAVVAYKALDDQLGFLAACVSVPEMPSTCVGGPSTQACNEIMKQKYIFWHLLKRMVFKRLLKSNERLGRFKLTVGNLEVEWSDILPLHEVLPSKTTAIRLRSQSPHEHSTVNMHADSSPVVEPYSSVLCT